MFDDWLFHVSDDSLFLAGDLDKNIKCSYFLFFFYPAGKFYKFMNRTVSKDDYPMKIYKFFNIFDDLFDSGMIVCTKKWSNKIFQKKVV